MFISKSIRINTCKSVSEQTALTLFRMNTYEKHRGVLWLTNNSSLVRSGFEWERCVHPEIPYVQVQSILQDLRQRILPRR